MQVIIWHSFYLARPWLLWGPALAIAWGSAAIAYLRRRRRPWQLVCADIAVCANTLTAITRSGTAGAVIDQCRQDIAMLERALSDSGGAVRAGRPAAGPVAAIEAVVGAIGSG